MTMKIQKIILNAMLIFSTMLLYGQSNKEVIENIKDANSYFYFEDYEEALPIYLKVIKQQPQNANILYRIGFCYLNIPGSKNKSIAYLEDATKNMAKNYQEENPNETRAPYDALFYLGNAYFVNNQIQQALDSYKKFRNITGFTDRGKWNVDYLEHQEETALNSLRAQRTTTNYLLQNIGSNFNDQFANYNAVVSGDGKTFAYTTKRKFYNAIYVATKKANGQWGVPINITLDLEVDGNCTSLSLSYDGKRLYLFKDENHDGNIFVSKFNGTKWSPMSKLNKNINTQHYETHACESPNGKILLFSSNRKGGFGDLDIYASNLTADGDWGPATNLGPVINTQFNENTPFITPNGQLLFFSSEGHNNIGGYDIFVAHHENFTKWETPMNLGYPINTTDDDLFFHPIDDGSKGLMAMFSNEGFGNQDIYELNIFIPKFMRSIAPISSLVERTSNKNFKTLAIDTISIPGTAIIDQNITGIEFNLYPEKIAKLFYNGRNFKLEERRTHIGLAEASPQPQQQQTQQQATRQSIDEQLLHLQKKDSSNKATASSRNRLLKQEYDTNSFINILQSKEIFGQSENASANNTSSIPSTDNANYLTELLLLLAPNSTQHILTPILKKNWQFGQFKYKEKLLEFTGSFNTLKEREAMITTFGRFLDYLGSHIQTPSVQKTKTISPTKNKGNFFDFYNPIINSASGELAEALGDVLVNNPGISSFEELFSKLRKTHPEIYNKRMAELLNILTLQSTNFYISLSDEDKYNLYTNFDQYRPSKVRPIILIGLTFLIIALLIAALIVARRRKQIKKKQAT